MADDIRVVVDGAGLVRDSAYRGIGTYCRNVIADLAEQPGLSVTVLAPRHVVVPASARHRPTLRVAPGRWAAAEHDCLLPLDLLRTPGDVLLSPGKYPPRWAPYPVVQTVHDVAPLVDPDAPASERREWQRTRRRWTSVAEVIAVSQYTAAEATRTLGLDPSRVSVVHHGIDPIFRPAPRKDVDPYVLFVGEYDPRKRHDLAFTVIGQLAEQSMPHRLKVAGRVAPWYADAMAELVAAAPRSDRIDILGHQPLAALVDLYQQADAVIVTSSAEGFGFPAVEAMACGTPVVAFDNSATSQVVADGGVLVTDGDVRAMTTAILDICRSPKSRAELARRARNRASRFTWEESARLHAGILRRVATSG